MTYRLATALRLNGSPVLVLTLDRGKRRKRVCRYGMVPVVRLSYPALRFVGSAWVYGKLLLWLWRHRRRYRSAIALTLDLFSLLACVAVAMLRKPAMARASGAYELENGVLRLDGTLRVRCVGWALRRLAALVAVNTEVRDRYLALGIPASRLVMLPNGVAVREFDQPPASPSGRTVLYMGRLAPFKGVSNLLQAWRRVSTQIQDGRLVILGGGEYEASLKAQALADGLISSVQFLGFVEDPRPWLSTCDLFVLPSEKEGMSNALLEAMAAGLPVVATRIAGNEAVVRDGVNGVLVAPENPDELAEAIIALLQNPERARRLGSQAKLTIASRFSLEAMVRQYQKVLMAGCHGS